MKNKTLIYVLIVVVVLLGLGYVFSKDKMGNILPSFLTGQQKFAPAPLSSGVNQDSIASSTSTTSTKSAPAPISAKKPIKQDSVSDTDSQKFEPAPLSK